MINSKQIQRPKLVLVVDDQEINRDALGVILEDDYEIICASDGSEALKEIQAHVDNLSIVLLDLMMPVMNGFEVLERMAGDDRMKHIPVIVLTADKSAELRALQMGAADFITKPFDVPEVIIARVARIIELSEGRQLISAAEHDPVTLLYSRNFFFEYANRLHHYSPELHLDAVVLDIEQFHTINAVNGRDFGDDVLRVVGAEIRDFLSETEGIACRFEADRFEIYCVPQPDYQALLERFQRRVGRISPNVSIHLRMGVNPWQEGVEPVLMFDRARAASTMVRGNYQSPLMIYDEDMRMRELRDRRFLNELRSAIQTRQLRVFYQPKYDIQCDPPRLSSAEALIRWQHPELGMISPGDFLPLFEGNGLIGVVDNYVWQVAAAQIAEWRKKYGVKLPVSVNLSRNDVFDPTLIDRLVRIIEDNGLDYSDMKMEVTESAYTEKANDLLQVVNRLRQLGFEIEMDDFGSGYSSLNMLSYMPIDVLKMDMKFVRNIESSETDLRLVKLILDIAKYLKLRVVAEGVETEGQLALLKDSGCDLVQGFYFSRPLPPESFEKLIERELEIERG
ncbi:MAG: EAL domain-containing protein [Clostridia bacterium]|nr:EAL domain-containing protein [Clostridia bacterium]